MTVEETQKVWDKVLSDHLYVLCQTTMAVSITRRTLTGYRGAEVKAIYLTKLLDRMKDKKRLANKLTNPETWGEEGERMKFDAIVGNPPYQISDGGAANSALPIYQEFYMQAKELHPDYLSMIMPSRWMSGGRGLDEFRAIMLNDKHIGILHDYHSATDCFPAVEIKGGICYLLRDASKEEKCTIFSHANGQVEKSVRFLSESNTDTFIRNQIQVEILKKVSARQEKKVTTILEAGRYFGFHTKVEWNDERSGTLQTADGKSSYPIRTKKDALFSVKVYVHGGICYIEPKNVVRHSEALDKYKVLLPRSGNPKSTIIGKPIISEPGSCNSNTYSVAVPDGGFLSFSEASNFVTYCKTRFFRALVSMKSFTQMLSPSAYSFVPMQDFSKPWTDAELYAKYGLTEDEIAFIEGTIRAME